MVARLFFPQFVQEARFWISLNLQNWWGLFEAWGIAVQLVGLTLRLSTSSDLAFSTSCSTVSHT